MLQREARLAEQESKVVVAEVPLLYEVGWEDLMDQVWVVYVHPETQLQRLLERSGFSREQAGRIIASQMPLEEKVRRADQVIDNNGTLEMTWEQVDALWKELGA